MEAVLMNVDRTNTQVDLSSVDAGKYPNIRLDMRNVDSVNLTPFQLDYWRLYYDPMPDGALAGNLFLAGKDTLESGDVLKFGIAFKNISHTNFQDSVSVKATILDRNNVLHTLDLPRYKKLLITDTITLRIDIDTKLYPGLNTLYLEVNPDKAQPEQYNFNNFLYKNFYVGLDDKNPIVDVTFDGVHILNRDIVSAKPHIQIKLKDDSKYLLLNDTALAEVQVKYPNNVVRTYRYDNDTLRFTPATSGSDNSMMLDFTPAFTTQFNPEGDTYELIIRGADKSGNKAGTSEYRTSFKVINKPMISNLLNYPNPFSTSTAFVFTITGSEIPQNIKIQILTVTGKIVREITIDELGPLRIGRNITEYKWDGKDQYGQKLGNGVYLYRVVSTMNGKPMEKYKAKTDNTDQYFTNGYGKMYLMR
jgi:flagellar hook assembly protein FlgD